MKQKDNSLHYMQRDIYSVTSFSTMYLFLQQITTMANDISKVNVKLSLCLTKHHAMKTYWGMEA